MTGLETLYQDFLDALDRVCPECRREGIRPHPGPKALTIAGEHGEDARGSVTQTPTCNRRSLAAARREGIYLHPGPKALTIAAEHGEDARGCRNTDAHLQSALVGRSETIARIDVELDLGEFGFI